MRKSIMLLPLMALSLMAQGSIYYPTPGSVLNGPTILFVWSQVSPPAIEYGLWVGSSPGSADIAAPPTTTGNSLTVNVPVDGRTIYVRIWTHFSAGYWAYSDCTFIAETPGAITSPANGSALDSSATFQWSGNAFEYGMWIGSTGPGSADIAAPPVVYGNSLTVNGLPTDGRTLYVRLWSQMVGGLWYYSDYAYGAGLTSDMSMSQTIVTQPATPDDYDMTTQLVSKVRKVKVSTGTIEIPRGDLVNIGNLRYQFSGSGPFTYSYQFDNSDLETVRLGDPTNIDVDKNMRLIKDLLEYGDVVPQGWNGSSGNWHARENPTRDQNASYSVTSKKLPGVMPIFFQGDVNGMRQYLDGGTGDVGIQMGANSKDNQAIADASSIWANSVHRFVIGPVFAPDATRDAVLARVKSWVQDYGFTFLKPLTEGHGLADLQPSNQLEQDIVDCLARVLK